MAQSVEPKVTSIKTYVGGSFLFSEDGFDYVEKPKGIQKQTTQKAEKVIQDRIGISEVRKELSEKRRQIRRKKESKNQKPTLIPIRDTPVEPVPQPPKDNQKCEMATQEQFQFFQSYVRQKEKQRKFEEQEEMRLKLFDLQQQMHKEKNEQAEAPNRGIALVMQKQEQKPKKRALMKITIKKKGGEEGEETRKMRVLE